MVDLRELRPWNRPEVIGLGRLAARPPLYPSEKLFLDGQWEFELFPDPERACDRVAMMLVRSTPGGGRATHSGRAAHSETAAHSASALAGTIPVPSNWTRQGHDRPHYTNVVMPWREPPPHLPEENPTGLYRRTFTVPGEWREQRVVLHVGGAEGCAVVWVNGVFLGFTKDSRMESEFDLTEVLCPRPEDSDRQTTGSRQAEIIIMVVRYSDGSYIEDQDQWWMAGLHRSIFLYATSSVYLQDCFVQARPVRPGGGAPGTEEPESGRIQVDLEVGRCTGADGGAPAGANTGMDPGPVDITLRVYEGRRYDGFSGGPDHRDDGDELIALASERISGIYGSEGWTHDRPTGGARARINLEILRPRLWSSEAPWLYRLEIGVTPAGDGRAGDASLGEGPSKDGSSAEGGGAARHDTYELYTGFRTVEVRDRKLLINGKAVLIRGVNRHEHDPERGKTLSRESMIADLKLLKRFNFNAVRTAHYPNCTEWYDLCDRYGIYLVDEANVEAHHYYNEVCRDPRYATAFLDRGLRMVLRDRNHPSVILWSLGNESGYGPNHDALAGWIRRADPTRPLHYEGAVRREWGQGPYRFGRGRSATDIIAPMYAPVEEIVAWARSEEGKADPRPLIMCEYSHAMGNSNGGLAEYVHAFTTVPGLQGGFIWDWVDQGLTERAPDGSPYWAYGGDYGDEPNDRDFCINGLVWPDRTPHPAMWECRKLFQQVRFEHAHPRNVRIHNEYDFTDLEETILEWEIAVNGVPRERGRERLPVIPAGGYQVITLGGAAGPDSPGERILTVRLRSGVSTDLLPRGHQIAWEQWVLGGRWTPTAPARRAEVKHEGFRLELDSRGEPHILSRGEVIRGPLPVLWRAPTDNDVIRNMPGQEEKPGTLWRRLGLDRLAARWEVVPEGGGTHLRGELRVPDGPLRARARIILEEPGGAFTEGFQRLCLEIDVEDEVTDLPRVGIRLDLPGRYDVIEWYGRGPQENYPDRCAGYPLGLWRSDVRAQYVPYIVPQEHGGHGETRMVRVLARGRSIEVAAPAGESFHFSALPLAPEDLDRLTHTWQVVPRDETILVIDRFHRGLGTGACGPDCAPRFRSGGGSYRWELMLRATDADPGGSGP